MGRWADDGVTRTRKIFEMMEWKLACVMGSRCVARIQDARTVHA